jgi:hypothetical protein
MKFRGGVGFELLVAMAILGRQLSEGLVMPRLLADPIAGPIRSLQGTAQSVPVGRFELDCDGQSRNVSHRKFRS